MLRLLNKLKKYLKRERLEKQIFIISEYSDVTDFWFMSLSREEVEEATRTLDADIDEFIKFMKERNQK